jgi:hypothetical protein
MKHTVVIHLVTVSCLWAVSSAHAHHSHPNFYDQCRSRTVEGRIESVQWMDPHTLIVVRLDDGTAHTIDWNGLNSLTNFGTIGPAKAALVSGVRIAVTGNPIRTSAQIRERSPDYKYEVNPNTVDPTLIRRVDGSWSWARKPGDRMPTSAPPPCADLTTK